MIRPFLVALLAGALRNTPYTPHTRQGPTRAHTRPPTATSYHHCQPPLLSAERSRADSFNYARIIHSSAARRFCQPGKADSFNHADSVHPESRIHSTSPPGSFNPGHADSLNRNPRHDSFNPNSSLFNPPRRFATRKDSLDYGHAESCAGSRRRSFLKGKGCIIECQTGKKSGRAASTRV